jgi:hypothetical protein
VPEAPAEPSRPAGLDAASRAFTLLAAAKRARLAHDGAGAETTLPRRDPERRDDFAEKRRAQLAEWRERHARLMQERARQREREKARRAAGRGSPMQAEETPLAPMADGG